MKRARPLLAIAASTVLAALALLPSAHADEPGAVAARIDHASVEPTWQLRLAGPEPRRGAGIGLSVSALAIEPGGAGAIDERADASESGLPEQIEYSLPGLMLAATSVPLVLVGVPLWATSEVTELGPTEVELGLGLSSLALRGSF